MRYKPTDLFHLLRTPVGRLQFKSHLGYYAWPGYSKIAWLYRRTLRGKVRFVVVVGSFGKSTTARSAAAALGLDPTGVTTGNAFSSLASAVMSVRPRDRHAVLEVGIDRPGQMATYARLLQPQAVIVTSIGSEHHRSLKTLDRTRSEKAEMVRHLDSSALAILNGDDPNVLWMRGETSARTMTFGFGEHNDLVAADPELDWPKGSRFELAFQGQRCEVSTKLLGRPGAQAVMGGVAAAVGEGLSLEEAAARVDAVEPLPGRLQLEPIPDGGFLLRDERKSSLETIDSALDFFAEVPASCKLIVIGDVSEPPGSSGPIYKHLGKRMAAIASRIVVIGGHRRRYAAGVVADDASRDSFVDAGHSLSAAVDAIQECIEPGAVVLVKGRDNQRLARVSLALKGVSVGCDIPFCPAKVICEECPFLESGWGGRKVVI